ncbi:MAG: 50S ribosomal protein L18 [Rickettsiales bacterium]
MKSLSQQRRSYSKKLRSKTSLFKRVLIRKTERHIYLLLIDDLTSKVIHNFSTLSFSQGACNKNYCNVAFGKKLAEEASLLFKSSLQGEKVLFDRRKHKYHGIVREVADVLRSHDIIS